MVFCRECALLVSVVVGVRARRGEGFLFCVGHSFEPKSLANTSIFVAYLDPNSSSLQKPIGGSIPYRNEGGRSLLAQKTPKSMLKTTALKWCHWILPSAQMLQLKAAEVKRRLISLDLCLFSTVKKSCVIVQNAVETCSTR